MLTAYQRPTLGAFVLILAFGILCGLALAGMMVDCGAALSLHDAGCACQ